MAIQPCRAQIKQECIFALIALAGFVLICFAVAAASLPYGPHWHEVADSDGLYVWVETTESYIDAALRQLLESVHYVLYCARSEVWWFLYASAAAPLRNRLWALKAAMADPSDLFEVVVEEVRRSLVGFTTFRARYLRGPRVDLEHGAQQLEVVVEEEEFAPQLEGWPVVEEEEFAPQRQWWEGNSEFISDTWACHACEGNRFCWDADEDGWFCECCNGRSFRSS